MSKCTVRSQAKLAGVLRNIQQSTSTLRNTSQHGSCSNAVRHVHLQRKSLAMASSLIENMKSTLATRTQDECVQRSSKKCDVCTRATKSRAKMKRFSFLLSPPHYLSLIRFDVYQNKGPRGSLPLKNFLAYLVVLCFERRRPKPMAVARFELKIFVS